MFNGLRLSLAEFLELPDDGWRYELIDGVSVMSPSPSARHQRVLFELSGQLYQLLRAQPSGQAFVEMDIHLGAAPGGGEIVYRPALIFIRNERVAELVGRVIDGAPDLVVEIASPGSIRRDAHTKRDDYERFGVREYWLIDPEAGAMRQDRAIGLRSLRLRVNDSRVPRFPGL